MRKALVFACAAVSALVAAAAPVKALLVVQNHVGEEYEKPLSNLATRLSSALSGSVFEIVNPDDGVGVAQNRQAAGEQLPASSAVRLAESLGAVALITASVDDYSVVTVGSPALTKRLTATMTLQAKRVPGGEGLPGAEVTVTTRNYTTAEFDQNRNAIHAELVSRLCRQAAGQLLPNVAQVKWTEGADKVQVAFGCNWPGASVEIDGISRGTAGTLGQAPLKLRVSPGVHRLKVSFGTFVLPFETEAAFEEGTSFMITLQETDEGIRRRQQDAYFAELLDRAHKNGAADDFCRTERARGYAKYLSSSYVRIKGMPQVLSKWNWGKVTESSPDLGLRPTGGDEEKVESTKEVLEKAAKEVEK